MRSALRWSWLAVLIASSCYRIEAFRCAEDLHCDFEGRSGTCERNGACSYADDACTSGARYSGRAGAVANLCVGADGGSSSSSSDESDTQTDPIAEICDGVDNDGDGLIDEYSVLNDACEGCALYEVASRSFAACGQRLAWASAAAACVDRGMTLASIHNDAEQAAADVTLPGPDSFWIGLNDRDAEGSFVFEDASPYDYFSGWATNEPLDHDGAEDCVSMRAVEGWSDRGCGVPLGYVCASPAR